MFPRFFLFSFTSLALACDSGIPLEGDTGEDTGEIQAAGIASDDTSTEPSEPSEHALHPVVALSDVPDATYLSSNLALVTWTKGMPTIEIGLLSEWSCFLARFSGALNGTSDGARVYVVDGKWYIRGDGAVDQVTAQCVSAQTMAAPEDFRYTWSQSEIYAGWTGASGVNSSRDRICGLTEVRGHFDSSGDEVRGYLSGLAWLLGGRASSKDQAIFGAVRCARPQNLRCTKSSRSWAQGQLPTKLPVSATPANFLAGRFCVLTRVAGKFDTAKEWVGLWYSGADTMLGGGSTTVGVSVEAQCTDGWVAGNPPPGFSDCL